MRLNSTVIVFFVARERQHSVANGDVEDRRVACRLFNDDVEFPVRIDVEDAKADSSTERSVGVLQLEPGKCSAEVFARPLSNKRLTV
jgi:hypothetical protein